MTDLLSRLRTPSDIHSVESLGEGFNISAKPDRIQEFTEMLREAINDHNGPYAVFATRVIEPGENKYDRAHILPFDA